MLLFISMLLSVYCKLLTNQKQDSTSGKKTPRTKTETPKSKKIKISKVVALKVKTKAAKKKVPNSQNLNKVVKKRVPNTQIKNKAVKKKVTKKAIKVPNISDEDSIVIKEEPLFFTIGEDCITCSYCTFTTFDLDLLSEHVDQMHSTFEEMEVKPDIN